MIAEAEAHRRVQAYGSLAQEVMDAGLAGVVAMGYNVYVGTAARFIGGVYAALLDGWPRGAAVTAARRQLADDSLRRQDASARPLHDWLVPVVYEAAPLAFETGPAASQLAIELGQARAEPNRERPDPPLLPGPDAGFSGRDETLLALDRTFDTRSVVLLHGYAGAGKTVTALEFARWYTFTGGVADALFTQFTSEMTLERLLDKPGAIWPAVRSEGPQRAALGEGWEELGESQRRESVVQFSSMCQCCGTDNVEQEAGGQARHPRSVGHG